MLATNAVMQWGTFTSGLASARFIVALVPCPKCRLTSYRVQTPLDDPPGWGVTSVGYSACPYCLRRSRLARLRSQRNGRAALRGVGPRYCNGRLLPRTRSR
jgi:hypothetical protein